MQQDRTAHCYVAQQGLGKVKRQKGRKFLPHLESLPVINSIQLVVSGSQNGKRREGGKNIKKGFHTSVHKVVT